MHFREDFLPFPFPQHRLPPAEGKGSAAHPAVPGTQQPRSGIYWAQAVPRSSSASRSTSSQPACLKHVHAGLQPKASLALSLGVLAAGI